jgi:hypothetical protein
MPGFSYSPPRKAPCTPCSFFSSFLSSNSVRAYIYFLLLVRYSRLAVLSARVHDYFNKSWIVLHKVGDGIWQLSAGDALSEGDTTARLLFEWCDLFSLLATAAILFKAWIPLLPFSRSSSHPQFLPVLLRLILCMAFSRGWALSFFLSHVSLSVCTVLCV